MIFSFKDKAGRELPLKDIRSKTVGRLKSVVLEFTVWILHLSGFIPFHHFRRFVYRLAGVKIGRGSTIHMGARFYNPRNIVIGQDTIIGEGVILDGRDKLVIGDHVDVASEVMIYNCQHEINDRFFSASCAPVIIEDYCFIGPRVIIQPGVKIGKGAVVAAGAVVTKDIAPFTVVGGVPAKIIGERQCKDLHYRLGRASWFR